MSEHFGSGLQQADLLDVKKQLFVDSASRNQNQKPTVKKAAPGSPIINTPAKRIQLRRNLKTEFTSPTPLARKQEGLRTSPNRRSPLELINEVRVSKFKSQHSKASKNSSLAQYYRIGNPIKLSGNRLANSFEQLSPEQKRNSLTYSRIYKENVINQSGSGSKKKEILSKSRKKMLFTIFSSKEKSLKKEQMAIKAHKVEYEIPYRYHSSITIDLFDSSISKSHHRSKSRSSNTGFSPHKRELSSNKKSHVNRSLIVPQDQRIAKALSKIAVFKFVYEYMSRLQIVEKLKFYALSNEPECKWPLMIVDEVFKKKKQEGKTLFT